MCKVWEGMSFCLKKKKEIQAQIISNCRVNCICDILSENGKESDFFPVKYQAASDCEFFPSCAAKSEFLQQFCEPPIDFQ